MRKIGITSGAYWSGWEADFDEAFYRMKEHGFDCVDLSLAGSDDGSFVIYQKSIEEFEKHDAALFCFVRSGVVLHMPG